MRAPLLEPLRDMMHQMVDGLFDNPELEQWAADGLYPSLKKAAFVTTVTGDTGVMLDLIIAIEPRPDGEPS